MSWAAVGALCLALAVALGAFGAHGLRDKLDAYSLSVYERAVFYHFVHAFGILVVAMAARAGLLDPVRAGRVAALLLGGIVLFSGSLYALAVTGVRALGAITPLGGIAFIAAWLWLCWSLLRA